MFTPIEEFAEEPWVPPLLLKVLRRSQGIRISGMIEGTDVGSGAVLQWVGREVEGMAWGQGIGGFGGEGSHVTQDTGLVGVTGYV